MRKRLNPFLILFILGVLSGCQAGTIGVGIFALFDDESSGGGALNSVPQVSVNPTPPRFETSTVSLIFSITDAEGDAASLLIEYSSGGGPFITATGIQIDSSPVSNPASGNSVGAHTLDWDSSTDLGPGTHTNVILRLTPSNGGAGNPDSGGPWTVGNVPPVFTYQPSPAGLKKGLIVIDYAIEDSTSDPTNITIQYRRLDTMFVGPATIAVGDTTNISTNPIPPGDLHGFAWDSAIDIPTDTPVSVEIIVTSDDGLSGGLALPVTTPVFQVINPADFFVEDGGPISPIVAADQIDAPIFRLRLSELSGASAVTVNGFSIQSSGSSDESTSILDADVYEDTNSNGRFDSGIDLLLSSTLTLPASNDGAITFTGMTEVITQGTNVEWLVVADLGTIVNAVPGDTFIFSIDPGSDVIASETVQGGSFTAATQTFGFPVLAAQTRDTDSNGLVDAYAVTFDRSVQDTSFVGTGITDSILAVTGARATPGGDITDDDTIFLGITEGQTDTGLIGDLNFPGGMVDDGGVLLSGPIHSGIVITDGVPPRILIATTGDGDVNGRLDGMTLTFSESVSVIDGNASDPFPPITISGYTVADADYATSGTTLALTIFENAPFDTGATPLVTYTTAPPGSIVDGAALEIPDSTGVTATDGIAPIPIGHAWYLDTTANGTLNAGDQVRLLFSEPLVLNNTSITNLELRVALDTFGTGAVLSLGVGPDDNQLIATIGSSPELRIRFAFNPAQTTAGSPSGLRISGTLPVDAIEDLNGNDVSSSSEVDIGPGNREVQTIAAIDTRSLVLADIDLDGDLDLAESHNDGTNRIYTNNGSGSFSTGTNPPTSGRTRALAFADIDNDGDPDLIGANDGGGTGEANQVWENGAGINPRGVFTAGHTFAPTTMNNQALAIGDVDCNGLLDIVFGADTEVRLHINLGGGAFDGGVILGVANTTDVSFADLDGDGDLDLITATSGVAANQIYLNNPLGTFSAGSTLGATDGQSLDIGDVDGDGIPDAALGVSGSGIEIWHGNGTGGATLGSTIPVTDPRDVRLVDRNGDGNLDLVVADGTAGGARIYFGDGSGTFTATEEVLQSGLNIQTLTVGDINKDGAPDFIAGYGSGQTHRVYFNDYSAWRTYKPFSNHLVIGTRFTSLLNDITGVALADFDEDGLPDLVAAQKGGGTANYIYLNEPLTPGVFTEVALFSNTEAKDVQAADLNRDGSIDIVFATRNGIVVHFNSGAGPLSGRFGVAPDLTLDAANDYRGTAIGDPDNDGDIDILGGHNAMGATLWRNDGSGGFTLAVGDTFATQDDVQGVAFGDVNKDGFADFITFERNALAQSEYWENAGDGTFTALSTSFIHSDEAENQGDVHLIDINNDGDLEAAYGFRDLDRVRFHEFTGVAWQLFPAAPAASTNNHIALAPGDLDQDGDIDFAVGQTGGGAEYLLLNDGTGTFTQAIDPDLDVDGRSAVMADIDQDGDLDVIFGEKDQLTIYRNDIP